MAYVLGKKSKNELKGVKCPLQAVVNRAIQITEQDFAVHDGLRTIAEQRAYYRRGVSKTMKSKHLTGDAVDLVPYINGKLRWEWDAIYPIAEAVRQAAQELDVDIRWGGAWDKVFTYTEKDPEEMVEAYSARRRKAGRRVFIDGPHFELA